jgi:hypothetical protein
MFRGSCHRESLSPSSTVRKLTSNFPGSPVTPEFDFVLKDGEIVSLQSH